MTVRVNASPLSPLFGAQYRLWSNDKRESLVCAKAARSFKRMDESTEAQWAEIMQAAVAQLGGLPDRLMAHLGLLADDFGGFSVDRLEHCLQTATRAADDGRDEEYVACALLHDIGDTLGPMNHADVAAAIVKPFVSEANHWMVEQHGVFQGYYFFHHIGLDRDMREQFRQHEYFDYTEEFCRKYDQLAFDPAFKSLPLADFEPVLRRVFARPKRSLYIEE
jgi:predicted HD phosphohydrolase